jgi:exopolysaccharide/PEP-CTERM locus tyrosine autokinase
VTTSPTETGSFVEKALNRLKRQEEDMAPLAELREETEAAPDPNPPESIRGVEPVAAAVPARRVIAVDRQRLLTEGVLAPENYQRQLADEYRLIKRPLIANAFGVGVTRADDGNLILISSAVSGEGKTHTCINLALSLAAETDRNVLLVDGDVAKPHISRLFGVADQPGLLDALGDTHVPLDQLLLRTDIPGLSLLPAGGWTDYSTELLASDRMRLLCRELADRYSDRIVLLDSPPLLATTEAQAIAQSVGQIVIVIAENATARDDVAAALDLLDKRKPINAILNKSRQPSVGGYHYGGYGYGSHGNAGQTAAGKTNDQRG